MVCAWVPSASQWGHVGSAEALSQRFQEAGGPPLCTHTWHSRCPDSSVTSCLTLAGVPFLSSKQHGYRGVFTKPSDVERSDPGAVELKGKASHHPARTFGHFLLHVLGGTWRCNMRALLSAVSWPDPSRHGCGAGVGRWAPAQGQRAPACHRRDRWMGWSQRWLRAILVAAPALTASLGRSFTCRHVVAHYSSGTTAGKKVLKYSRFSWLLERDTRASEGSLLLTISISSAQPRAEGRKTTPSLSELPCESG